MKVSLFVVPLLTVLFCAGAAGQAVQVKPDPPRPSNPTSDATAPSAAPKLPDGVGQPVDPNKYLIGPEDILYVQTFREADFTRSVSVRPDGKITMPLIGDVQAAGLTPLALTADLKERIGKYVNNPEVTVSITDVRSKKYYIDGEVGRPGSYPLITPTRVLEALSMAGGFREFANESKVIILRGSQTFRFNYKEVIKGKKLEQNRLLESGDHIIVK